MGEIVARNIPRCLSLSSQIFRETVSRRFRMAKTTTNRTAMPIVNIVPVRSAAKGKIDKPSVALRKQNKNMLFESLVYVREVLINFEIVARSSAWSMSRVQIVCNDFRLYSIPWSLNVIYVPRTMQGNVSIQIFVERLTDIKMSWIGKKKHRKNSSNRKQWPWANNLFVLCVILQTVDI